MKATFLASIAVAALFGAPAFAADMAVKAPPLPPPALNWTGCYIGGQVGFAGGLSEHSFSNGAPSDSSSSFGALGGGLASCDYQWNNFVLGVEGDFEAADLTGNFSNATGATSVGTSHMTDDGSVRGRIGAVFADSWLLYVTGGWAFAHYNFGGGPFPPPPCCGFSANPDGWTAGLGVEHAFTDRIFGRVEYRHSDYGTSTGPLPPTFPGVLMSVRNTTDALRFGLTFKLF